MVQRYDPNNPFREIKEAFPNQITTDWKAMYEVLKECNTAIERERDELLQKVQVLEKENALLRKRLEPIETAAIALVQRLELDKDVKKNKWWLNERAKIMEVIDDNEGCDEN